MKFDSAGPFEQLVLTAILALRDDAYGVSIHSKVAEMAKPRNVSLGAVYVTLDKAVRYVVSKQGEPMAVYAAERLPDPSTEPRQ